MPDAERGSGRRADDTDLAEIDLGLLLALEALLRERNVTRAASRLNIGQPALSARLNRLRQVFADPLFVPAAAGRGVVPTTRAVELQAELADVLGTSVAWSKGRPYSTRSAASAPLSLPSTRIQP